MNNKEIKGAAGGNISHPSAVLILSYRIFDKNVTKKFFDYRDPETSNGTFCTLKRILQGMMDVALITANANQLRFVVEYNQTSTTYAFAITLIIISLVLQVVVGICLIFKGR